MIIWGIMIAPMAATVAGAEPEIAPKNMQAMIVTMPRPPVIFPTRLFATATIRFEIPPVSMMLPAHFTKLFMKRIGYSPNDYRMLHTNIVPDAPVTPNIFA